VTLLDADRADALCSENHGEAEPTGAGPLDGLTFVAKDVFDVAGQRTGFGQPTWLEARGPATDTAPAVRRLLSAGARMTGRAICDELTYSLTGENVHYGTPLNPACPDRIPGGSSSGSASAVAAGLCDLSIGTDCAGSVRIPASYCGLYGMRPTHGRVPLDGAPPFAPSFDTVGWFAREPALLDSVGRVLLDDHSHGIFSSRALVAADAFALVDPAVAAALQPAVRLVEAAIGEAREVTVADEGLSRWMECFRTIQGFEIWQSLGGFVRDHRPSFGPGVRERFEWAATVTKDAAERERRFRGTLIERLDALVRPGDVLVLPTSPRVAPLRGLPPSEIEDTYRYQAISLLCIAGLGGLPQVTLPVAQLHGCPLGLSLVSARDGDVTLLELASQLHPE
jgi:amidase